MNFIKPLTCALACILASAAVAQNSIVTDDVTITEQDRLRGSVTPERQWWDVKRYELALEVFPETKTISGSNVVNFVTLTEGHQMQIDLQPPLEITKIIHGENQLAFARNENVYLIDFEEPIGAGLTDEIKIFYSGSPTESKNPPWSGGFTWRTDGNGEHFIATTCQGIGASIWWPNKDHGYDEPDNGMSIAVTVPENLVAVSNGRLTKTTDNIVAKTKTFHWNVVNPINNYGVNVNVGNYVNFQDTYKGEFGELDVDYWVLAHQRETAEKHFKEVPRTIEAFEHWFGKYPFYEDSFKMVVVPYLGMEHQSSVSYGNKFQNGYNGIDLSGTGVGMKFDFIIVHESGHEWFGNSISMKDNADMWIHESFTNYSENLFVEYHFTKKEGADYVIGCRKRILNDRPIIGVYDANKAGSGDMYYKGGNVLHTLRHMLNDDDQWLEIMRGLNKTFWHQTVTTQQIEDFLNEKTGLKLKAYFNQYLRTTDIPKLVTSANGKSLSFNLEKVVDGFQYPVRVLVNGKPITISPSVDSQTIEVESNIESVELDRNFYMEHQHR